PCWLVSGGSSVARAVNTSGSSNAVARPASAASTVTVATSRLHWPIQVSRSTRPTAGPSSRSAGSKSCSSSGDEEEGLAMGGSVVAQRLDGGGPEAELREDLRPVLQVAHQRAAP